MKFNIKHIIKESYLYITNNISLIENSIGTIIIKGLGMLIQFLTFPIYIRYFGNANLAGIWLTVVSILTWISLFDFGIGQGLRNSLSVTYIKFSEKEAKELISTAYAFTLLIVIVLVIIELILLRSADINCMFKISKNIIDASQIRIGLLIVILGVTFQLFFNLVVYVFYAIQKPVEGNSISLITNILILLFLLAYEPKGSMGHRFIIICTIHALATNIPCIIASIILYSNFLRDYSPSIKSVSREKIASVFKIGGVLFWLQIVWLIISKTNEILIMRLTSSENVIEYQVYNKIFNLVGSFVIASFVPIWSAVTKAHAEKKYAWIKLTYKKMLVIVISSSILEIVILFVLQYIVNIWLKDTSFRVNYANAGIVLISNCMFVLHSANTNISNGMSNFRLQTIVMTSAAIIDIPLSIVLTNILNNWIGIVLANILVLSIFEILQVRDTFKRLNMLMGGLENAA